MGFQIWDDYIPDGKVKMKTLVVMGFQIWDDYIVPPCK